MNESVGFLVVEFNQASHEPNVRYSDVYRYRYEADEYAAESRERARRSGRRETYAVAELLLLEDPA